MKSLFLAIIFCFFKVSAGILPFDDARAYEAEKAMREARQAMQVAEDAREDQFRRWNSELLRLTAEREVLLLPASYSQKILSLKSLVEKKCSNTKAALEADDCLTANAILRGVAEAQFQSLSQQKSNENIERAKGIHQQILQGTNHFIESLLNARAQHFTGSHNAYINSEVEKRAMQMSCNLKTVALQNYLRELSSRLIDAIAAKNFKELIELRKSTSQALQVISVLLVNCEGNKSTLQAVALQMTEVKKRADSTNEIPWIKLACSKVKYKPDFATGCQSAIYSDSFLAVLSQATQAKALRN